eukprot:TRINITY_DN1486_c0_g1_i1.p4 TRINITY_DN1486_c0_g1~~TRINITY_DN1486_c0_g1_i1.p4  ORF type:complete len:112 (+),score=26.51 TRINITY_DN1486_c0_g1_i1:436-771(+)
MAVIEIAEHRPTRSTIRHPCQVVVGLSIVDRAHIKGKTVEFQFGIYDAHTRECYAYGFKRGMWVELLEGKFVPKQIGGEQLRVVHRFVDEYDKLRLEGEAREGEGGTGSKL